MEKILIAVFLVMSFIITKAQNWPPPQGSHVADTGINKFIGTWQWVNGTDTLIIKLYKQELYMKPPVNYYFESIVGWHRYVKNGVVKESSLQYAGQPYMGGHSTILGGSKTAVQLYGSFNDLTKDKRCDLYLTMTNGSFTQMTWKLRESRGIVSGNFQWGFTLPTELVLTRQ